MDTSAWENWIYYKGQAEASYNWGNTKWELVEEEDTKIEIAQFITINDSRDDTMYMEISDENFLMEDVAESLTNKISQGLSA